MLRPVGIPLLNKSKPKSTLPLKKRDFKFMTKHYKSGLIFMGILITLGVAFGSYTNYLNHKPVCHVCTTEGIMHVNADGKDAYFIKSHNHWHKTPNRSCSSLSDQYYWDDNFNKCREATLPKPFSNHHFGTE